jgi:murein DD-endopeptidase MepM/ murein hydrolase activator NlpD
MGNETSREVRSMSCDLRSATKRPVGLSGAAVVLTLAMAGCSTDFRRLESPSLASGERAPPRPSEGIGGRRSGAGAPLDRSEPWTESGPRSSLPPSGSVSSQPLPPPARLPLTAGLSKPFDKPKPARPAEAAARRPIATTGSIEVQPGDTLYAIARRNNVSLAELMEANQLTTPNLKPGQKLALPNPTSRRPASRPTAVASAGGAIPPSAVPVPSAPPAAPAVAAPAPAAGAAGTHTVKPGELLSTIARQYKVSVADLQAANAIADPRKVRPGTVLQIPRGSAPASAPSPVPTTIAAPVAPLPGVPQPKVINAQRPEAPAAPGPVTAEAAPVPAVAAKSASRFRWPVTGQVVQSFGPRPDGTPSDGIAIATPVGTDVAAAGDGTVAYAGSELKGYGNLILVRHEDGWVSAYAHASEILVKRGDTVKRGQTIAKSGQTGAVDAPVLHFELREGTKPVDPVPHLGKT